MPPGGPAQQERRAEQPAARVSVLEEEVYSYVSKIYAAHAVFLVFCIFSATLQAEKRPLCNFLLEKGLFFAKKGSFAAGSGLLGAYSLTIEGGFTLRPGGGHPRVIGGNPHIAHYLQVLHAVLGQGAGLSVIILG